MQHQARTKVFYNSACPVCDAGIAAQKEKMGGARSVDWIDIHRTPDAVVELGADLEFVRERLHVKGEDGHVSTGYSALMTLWAKTPGQRPWAVLADMPILRHIGNWCYNLFAAALYRWNRLRKRWPVTSPQPRGVNNETS